MYQSYSFNNYGWKIVDDDFTETTEDNNITLWRFIIDTYEKHNLPVVPNLIRAIIRWADYPPSAILTRILSANNGYLDLPPSVIDKYRAELEKYLLLL